MCPTNRKRASLLFQKSEEIDCPFFSSDGRGSVRPGPVRRFEAVPKAHSTVVFHPPVRAAGFNLRVPPTARLVVG